MIRKYYFHIFEKEPKRLKLASQEALTIFNPFKGQVTQPVLDFLKENNIAIVHVLANMTNLFQPLDLTVSEYAGRSLTDGMRIRYFSNLIMTNLLKKEMGNSSEPFLSYFMCNG